MTLRRFKKIFLAGLLLVLALALLLVASVSALVATEAGSRWAIHQAMELLPKRLGILDVGELRGNLLTGLDVSYFDFQQTKEGKLHQQYRGEKLSFRWQPLALFYSAVSVQSLHADNLVLVLPPAEDKPKPEIFVWPSFALPVRIELGNVQLENIHLLQGEKKLLDLQSITGSLSVGTFNFRVTDLTAQATNYRLALTGRSGLRFPYASDLTLQWQYKIPVAADAPAGTEPIHFNGEGKITGDLNELRIAHQLSTPFVINSEGLLLPNLVEEAGQPKKMPYADIENTWSEQSLLSQWFFPDMAPPITNADLRIKGWYDDYQASLDGEIMQEKFGNFSVAAEVRGDFKQLDIASLVIRQAARQSTRAPAELKASGEVSWLPEVNWNLALEANHSDLAQHFPEWPGNIQLSMINKGQYRAQKNEALPVDGNNDNKNNNGNKNNDGNKNEARKNLSISAEKIALSGQLRGLDLNGDGSVAFDGQRWQSEKLSLSLGANQLSLTGSYAEQIDVTWQVEAPLLAQIDPQLTGSLSSRGELKGTLAAPRLNIAAQGKDLRWQNYALQNLDLKLNQAVPGSYNLLLDANNLRLGEQHFTAVKLTGAGTLAHHDLTGSVASENYGEVDFKLDSHYQDASWKGKFNDLQLRVKNLPRWWLSSSEWIEINQQQLTIGRQCLTTRANWNGANNSGINASANGSNNGINSETKNENKSDKGSGENNVQKNAEKNLTESNPPTAAQQSQASLNNADDSEKQNSINNSRPQSNSETPLLCFDGKRDVDNGLIAKASLRAVPLRQIRAWLKPDVSLGGVIDGDANLRSPAQGTSAAADGLFATFQLQTRDGELRYQYAGDEPSIYRWRSTQVKGEFNKNKLTASLVTDWAEYGKINADTIINFASKDISGKLNGNLANLAPLEAIVPFLDDVSGRLVADMTLQGKLQKPQVLGQIVIDGGAAKLPGLGLDLSEIALALESRAGGQMNLRAEVKSGEGKINVNGELNNLGGPDWRLTGKLAGENFQIIQQKQLKANITPAFELTASASEIRITGDAKIPYARADIKALPASATRVSRDVIIIDEEASSESALAGIPVFANINLELGDDVKFKGFGLNSKLVGKINILQAPPRALLTTGYVSVVDGKYEAYGQELEIERGRLLFQGPYENPGLDIRALRKTPEYTEGVAIEIGGTLRQPTSQVIALKDLSESESMAILLTGKPLSEASAGEAYALFNALSGRGMNDEPGIKEGITQALRVDELSISAEDGLEQSSLLVGKYLSPKLFVRYVVGLFDQAFSIGVRYQMTDRLRLEAESGEAQSVDMIYNIER